MSVRKNAPYQDRVEDGGRVLIYEGHDLASNHTEKDPKLCDQPEYLPSGNLTQNGKFHSAVEQLKSGKSPAEVVRVYQKVLDGVWVFNGSFKLVELCGKKNLEDAWFSNLDLNLWMIPICRLKLNTN